MERILDGMNPRVKGKQASPCRLKLVDRIGPNRSPLNFLAKKTQRDRMVLLGNLAAVFAHEVANPLTGLSASLQFALNDLRQIKLDRTERTTVDLPIIQRTLQGALREVDRLVALLNEFRSAVPAQPLDLEPSDLERVIREILFLEGPVYQDLGITMTVDCAADLPAVGVDGGKFKQAILNLCKNAVEAMDGGGVLTLKAYGADGAVVLEISDTGCGVPDDIAAFELFQTTKIAGTGLGLPIVRQIVSAHGGTVDYSSDGARTTFTIRLPALTEAFAFAPVEGE